jgi:fructokinase
MVTRDPPLVAGIELGGTKGVALIARGQRILRSARVATGKATATLTALSDHLAVWSAELGPFEGLGIASFGPVGLDPTRRDFGFITRTTKPGWSNVNVRGHFANRFAVPIGFDTDVAGAALSETLWGAGVGRHVVVYVTVGTGIGGGVVVDGQPLHGRVHPELGHLRIRRAPGDHFPGVCVFHGDCLEGLASGPAIAARAGTPAETLGPDHPVWAEVADSLAEMASSLILTLSPDRILIGGGVATGKPFLFPMIRAATLAKLAGYVAGLTPTILARIVRPPALGDHAGPLGAVALGVRAMRERAQGNP